MKKVILFTCLVFLSNAAIAQRLTPEDFVKNGEVVLATAKSDIPDREAFNRVASLDHKHSHDSVYYYVMQPEMEAFNDLGIPFSRKPHPNEGFDPEMIDVKEWNLMKATDCNTNLTAYPTYGLYEQIMADFAADFPDICRLEVLGTLQSGRKILALRITDNPDLDEAEPRFLYTSTMHGDETAGYILSIRLIREMLCGYGSDERITGLVNNVEIWINPLANPDGTYWGGNNTVGNARRGNGNNIDLNRNFPDPAWGPFPYGVAYQPETVIFMNFAEAWPVNLSSNMHGGIELINYAWDAYAQLHADNAWWVHVCREYADTAQANSPTGYFNDLNNGITNGYAWYPVHGGRQDYVTYFRRGRETTLELTSTKLMSTTQFESRWNYNRNALYNYLEQALYGLRGIVTDAITGNSIEAEITIEGHDNLNSSVFSRLPNGNYHRYLKQGAYFVTFSADGYVPQTLAVNALDNNALNIDVALMPINTCNVQAGVVTATSQLNKICPGDGTSNLVQVSVAGNVGLGRFGLATTAGDIIASNITGNFNMDNYLPGTYRIGHVSYGESVSLAGISNIGQLQGCFALSNFVQFTSTQLNGGTSTPLDPTTVCAGSNASVTFINTGNAGPNKKWVLLNNNFTETLSIQNSPVFDFSNTPVGTYKVVHIAFANGVNLQQVQLPAVPECIAISNQVVVQVVDCGAGFAGASAGYEEIFLKLSPNPVADMLRIEIGPGAERVEIMDSNGRLVDVLFQSQNGQEGNLLLQYSTPHLAQGLYYCRVSGSTAAGERFLVVR